MKSIWSTPNILVASKASEQRKINPAYSNSISFPSHSFFGPSRVKYRWPDGGVMMVLEPRLMKRVGFGLDEDLGYQCRVLFVCSRVVTVE